jgi:hypothetical protein
MTKLGLALFLTLSTACASSTPAPKDVGNTPPPATEQRCDVESPELYAARTTPLGIADAAPESGVVLLRSGIWSVTEMDGTIRRGCLSDPDRARAETLLADLPLDVREPRDGEPRCMAEPTTRTTYAVHGKGVYTDEMCSGTSLDEVSQQALAEVDALVRTAAAAQEQ